MRALFGSRLTMTLLLLVAATVASFVIGHGSASDHEIEGGLVIGIACLKIRFVAVEFMELRTAPPLLRAAAELLPAILAVVLILVFLATPHSSSS